MSNGARSIRRIRGRKVLAASTALGALSITAVVGTTAPTASAAGSGTINFEWSLPTSWDPVASTAGTDVHDLGLVYAGLTEISANGAKVLPALAKSWKFSPDGKSLTFTLRPNLKFSDGSPLTATSVKENIQRGKKQTNSGVAAELEPITSVVVDSPTKVTFDLSAPDYQIPDLMAGKDGQIVNPKYFNKVTSLSTQPEGAGPFKLTSYVPDSHANMVANPYYWDAKDIHVSAFNVEDITDPQQILSGLESGQINVAFIPGSLAASAKKAGFRIDAVPALTVEELDTQTTTKPFNNPKVVEALNYGIDRKALVQVQQAGYGAPSYQPFPKGYVGYVKSLGNLYPYNPKKAKQLLAQAGYSKGVNITLTSETGGITDAIAEQIQSQLKQVGVNLKITDIPSDQLTQLDYVDKSLPWVIDGTAGRQSPLEMLQVLYQQDGFMNIDGKTAKQTATITNALNKVQTLPLTSAQYPATLQSAVKTAVLGDPIHLWLYYTPRILAVSSTVTGIPQDLVQQRWEGARVKS